MHGVKWCSWAFWSWQRMVGLCVLLWVQWFMVFEATPGLCCFLCAAPTQSWHPPKCTSFILLLHTGSVVKELEQCYMPKKTYYTAAVTLAMTADPPVLT